jgi:hypothetical protein
MEKYLNFYKPFLEYIDSGKFFRNPFSWLYAIFAALNLLVPIVVLYFAFEVHWFSMGGSYVFGFLLFWIVLIIASWLACQIWWNRRKAVAAQMDMGEEFVATPAFCHYLQTFGEALGSWVAIVGAGSGLVTWLIIRGGEMESLLPIPFVGAILGGGLLYIVLMPVYGFIIIVSFRFVSEQCKALVTIARNTKRG